MSNNSQDEPDAYEIIFDGSNSDSAKDPTIEVSDAETVGTPEYIDAEIAPDTDDFMKNHQSDAEDEDIEDGIFAPARKEKTAGKKTAPLMWAVSLLAFVGVGAFVYVQNPDIVSKMTHNIGSSEDVTLPNTVAATEDHLTQAIDPNQIADSSDSAEVKPDAISSDAPQDQSQDASVDAVPTPADAVVAPTVDLLTSEHTPVAQPEVTPPVTATTEPATEAAPTPVADAVVVDAIAPTPDVTTPEAAPVIVAAAEPVIAPTVEPTVEMDAPPVTTEATPATATIDSAPSSEIIIPTNDKEEGDDAADGYGTHSQAITPAVAPTVSAPMSDETPAPVANPQPVPVKSNASVKSKADAPKIVASKEEQKVLDDAHLAQYFDSPNGKMLKDIPAPSMDPKKGNNESIIVVNKKGQKTKSEYSKPAGKISIETTSLNAQMVSANRAMKLGRYDAAKEMYDELYKLNPRDGQILSGRAILLQKMGFADQAITAYEELLKLYPDNTDAIVNLSGLIRKQYPAVALGKLLDLHMKYPNNVAVTAQLGVAYADSGNYVDALRYLGDASAMEPKNALHFFNMAVISEKAKKSEQAISYYEKALEVDAIYGEGRQTISKEKIYDRLAQIRGN